MTCKVCSAETIMVVAGEPLCVRCDDELEKKRKAKRMERSAKPPSPPQSPRSERQRLTDRYTAAVRQYQFDVRELARAAGGYELDAFDLIKARCRQSKLVCAEIRQQLSSN